MCVGLCEVCVCVWQVSVCKSVCLFVLCDRVFVCECMCVLCVCVVVCVCMCTCKSKCLSLHLFACLCLLFGVCLFVIRLCLFVCTNWDVCVYVYVIV